MRFPRIVDDEMEMRMCHRKPPSVLFMRILFIALFAAILTGITATVSGQDSLDYRPRQVLRNPIRAITDPPIVSADQSGLSDNELVIGVEVKSESRAYPINQLTGPMREIINDDLAGTAIAATW